MGSRTSKTKHSEPQVNQRNVFLTLVEDANLLPVATFIERGCAIPDLSVHLDTEPAYAYRVTAIDSSGSSTDTSSEYTMDRFVATMKRKFDKQLYVAQHIIKIYNDQRVPQLRMLLAVVMPVSAIADLILEFASPWVSTS